MEEETRPAAPTTTPPVRGMHRRVVILAIVLFALLIAGMFTFAWLKQQELQTTEPLVTETDGPVAGPYAGITRIDGKHFYSDGVHTVVGEVPMPTPCDLLESDAMVMESFPEQIQLNFTVVNNAENCIQVITPQRFKVEAGASEEATFSATLQGQSVELNLVEAAPGETPDDFELFIKG